MKYLKYFKIVLAGWTLAMFLQTLSGQFVNPDEIMACALLFQYT